MRPFNLSWVWIVTDGSQARGSTKQQLQSLRCLQKPELRFVFVVAIALEKLRKRMGEASRSVGSLRGSITVRRFCLGSFLIFARRRHELPRARSVLSDLAILPPRVSPTRSLEHSCGWAEDPRLRGIGSMFLSLLSDRWEYWWVWDSGSSF